MATAAFPHQKSIIGCSGQEWVSNNRWGVQVQISPSPTAFGGGPFEHSADQSDFYWLLVVMRAYALMGQALVRPHHPSLLQAAWPGSVLFFKD